MSSACTRTPGRNGAPDLVERLDRGRPASGVQRSRGKPSLANLVAQPDRSVLQPVHLNQGECRDAGRQGRRQAYPRLSTGRRAHAGVDDDSELVHHSGRQQDSVERARRSPYEPPGRRSGCGAGRGRSADLPGPHRQPGARSPGVPGTRGSPAGWSSTPAPRRIGTRVAPRRGTSSALRRGCPGRRATAEARRPGPRNRGTLAAGLVRAGSWPVGPRTRPGRSSVRSRCPMLTPHRPPWSRSTRACQPGGRG